MQYDNESEVEDLMNPTDELKKKIVTLADTMRKWNDANIKARKTVKKQIEEIVNLGLNRYHMERIDLRRLVEKIFRYHSVSESWIRKLLPIELKDSSKTRISYLQRQEIEKERQRLLQQQASESQQESEIGEYSNPDGSTVESASYQPVELELTPYASEIRQGLEVRYELGNNSLDHEAPSHSKEPVEVQNEPSELSEAYKKKIEKLEADVRRLSEQFVAKTNLQAYSETFSLIVHIDPVEKSITWIEFEKGSGI